MLGKELSSKPSMRRLNAFNRVEAYPIYTASCPSNFEAKNKIS